MNAAIRRAYAEEIAISRPIGLYKNALTILCAGAIMLAVVFDVLDRAHNLYYFRSLLASIVGLGLIASMYRYTRHVVDDARAGPDYFVFHTRGVSATIALEQIKAVRFNVFTSYYFMPERGFLERFEVELSHPSAAGAVFAFCPPTDWRESWVQTHTTRMLFGAT